MDVQHLLDIVFGLFVAITGGFLKMLHSKVESTSERLSRFETQAAREYASKEDVKEMVQEMKTDLRDIKEYLMGANGNGNHGGRKK